MLLMKGLIVSALVLCAGAAVAQLSTPDEVKSELAKLSGTWIRELDGKSYIFQFNGEKFVSVSVLPNETIVTVATIIIDPTRKPKHIDMTFSDGLGRAVRLKGKTQLDIYELDEDALKLCIPRGQSRPEAFPSQENFEGGDYFYIVLRRAK
jgi:uncharacterized protein (TIGR03067 family)